MPSSSKEKIYEKILSQLNALLSGETEIILKMSSINAVLHIHFQNWSWVGFYIVHGKELLVGPYISDHIGCLHIPFGKGVCGTAWKEQKTQIVPDVRNLKNYIACDSKSQSEIVIPVFNAEKKLIAVFDADSNEINDFDLLDGIFLEKILTTYF